ncbi:MAG: hypothetical protein AAGA86_11615, partial [Bacteroidota bacterium]
MEKHKYLKIKEEEVNELMKWPPDQELVMMNFLKYRDTVEGTERTGRDSYAEYMKMAKPFFKAVGGRIVFFGRPQGTLIGPKD